MTDTPKQFPAQVLDRLVAATGRWGNWTIQLDLTFPARLSAERLHRAAELALDAEPVLGCRFVAAPGRPHWLRLAPSERLNYRQVVRARDYQRCLCRGVDAQTGPLLRLTHQPLADGRDRLALAVSHAAADAAGLVEACALVADTYRRLAADAGYRPTPNLDGARATTQVLAHVPLRAYPQVLANILRELGRRRAREPLLGIPVPAGGGATDEGFVHHRLRPARVAALRRYGRERRATLNDVILAAFFRALAALNPGQTGQLVATTTANLRRYLPAGRGGAICNLSSLQDVGLGADPGADFEATLARVSAIMRRRKEGWIGLMGPLILQPLLGLLPHARLAQLAERTLRRGEAHPERRPPVLTNIGPLDAAALAFDQPPVEARFLPQLLAPPNLQVAASGYGGAIHLISGAFPSAARARAARDLFAALEAALPRP